MKIKTKLVRFLSVILGILFVFMTFLVIYQVVSRYVFNSPLTFTEDLLGYSFVWLTLIGTTILFSNKEHMNIDFIVDKFPKNVRASIDILIDLLVIVVAIGIFIYGGFKVIQIGGLQMSPTLNIPLSYVYSILPITGVLLIIICLCNVYEKIISFKERG